MEIIYVKNADAVEIVKTLEKLLSDKSFAHNIKTDTQVVTKSVSKMPNTKTKKQPVVQTNEPLPHIVGKNKPTVTVDTELNAVVVYATEREIKEITSVIEKLDVERQQVYIKARIFEFSDDKASEIGMKYGLGGGIINSSGIFGFSGAIGTLEGGLTPVTNFSALLGGLTASNQNLVTNLDRALALGVTLSLYKKNGATSIISEPSILCVNNKESSLYSGRTESILSQSSTAASSTALTQNSYTREDIGLTLKVKPRISADNKVSLEIKASLEDVIGGTPGAPTTTKSEVETVSIVTNGETVIIGGLSKEKDIENVSKIPILGDIPILGIPFRHKSGERKKSNIVIMITPYIVKKSEDLASIKDVLGQMELLENKLADDFDKKHRRQINNNCDSADYYYEINEYGERTKVYTDVKGRVIKRELEQGTVF
jgi:general secretion pathway protein D